MAATYPKFDGFSLQDDNYIIEEIGYRNSPSRSTDFDKIARRPGVKLLSSDFAERKVTMSGYIKGTSVSDLRDKIDTLHTYITRKEAGALNIESDRTGTAIVSNVTVTDPHYAQDMVPFSIEFLMPDPFFYGAQQTVNYTIASGTSSTTLSVSISGSVFAEPLLVYSAPTGTGFTTTSGIFISYNPTGETLTWSGTSGVTKLAYGNTVSFDYSNYRILLGTSEVDLEGVFSRWEPVSTNFTVTFSGTAMGGSMQLSYQPRYL